MKKFIALALVSLSSVAAQAQAGDLVLPGEKWLAGFTKYVCDARGTEVAAPSALQSMNLVFESVTTDSTLDNALLKATFTENGVACRYNALIFADNAAQTARLVESKAYAPAADGDCLVGKSTLDRALTANDYLYYGHPHNLALMMTDVGAEEVCGEGATAVGANFVVKGRIKPPQQ